MPEQDRGPSEFAKKVVAALEKERPRRRIEREVMGIRPDLFPELDGKITVEHQLKKPVDPGPYVPRSVMVGGLPARKLRHDLGTAPDGSPVPDDDPMPGQNLPGTDWGRRKGAEWGATLRQYVPEGLRRAGADAIAAYGAMAAPPNFDDPEVVKRDRAAHELVRPIVQPEALGRLGQAGEQWGRDHFPQYKYDRSLQDYIRALQNSGAIDGGEIP